MRKMSEEEFQEDMRLYNELNADKRFQIRQDKLEVCLNDKYDMNASFGVERFAQSVWGARKVLEANPLVHYDIGSAIGGFIAHLLSFRENIYLFDNRPIDREIPGITYIQDDIVSLTALQSNSIDSLSSMDVVQKVGLGLYGEPIEPNAWERMLWNFSRVMKQGGKLYVSVPIGETDTIFFNKGRQFKIQTIVDALPELQLLEFSGTIGRSSYKCIYLDEKGEYIYEDAILENVTAGSYGMFEFIKW